MTDAARVTVASHPVLALFMPYRSLPCAAAQRSAIGRHLFTSAHCVLLHASSRSLRQTGDASSERLLPRPVGFFPLAENQIQTCPIAET